jgi:MoxR-like ATPase
MSKKTTKPDRSVLSSYQNDSDTTQVLDRPWFKDVFNILETQLLLLLVGKPGSSKTTLARHAAHELNGREPIVLQGSPEIEQQHVWGYERLLDGNMIWGDGFLPRALKEERWLVVEDFNQIPLDVRAAFLDLRDNRSTITNPLNGEVIPVPAASPHDFRFRLVCTANPESMKCLSNKMIAQSLLDGFVTIPEVPPIEVREVEQLLRLKLPHASEENIQRGISEWQKFKEIRGKKDSTEASGEDLLTYRAAEQLVQLLETGLSLEKAIEYALVSKFVIDSDLYTAAKLKLKFE